MLIQWPDRYYHSDLDTVEHCDPDSLALAVRAAATYAGFVAAAGAEEAAWLLQLVARGARRRLLSALERPDPWDAAHAERERGQRALASVARLAHGLAPDHALARAIERTLPLARGRTGGLLGRRGDPRAAGTTAGTRRAAGPRPGARRGRVRLPHPIAGSGLGRVERAHACAAARTRERDPGRDHRAGRGVVRVRRRARRRQHRRDRPPRGLGGVAPAARGWFELAEPLGLVRWRTARAEAG
jgi:hypothetical protein